MVWEPPGERWKQVHSDFNIQGNVPEGFKEAVGHNYKVVDKDPAVVRQMPWYPLWGTSKQPIEHYQPRAEVLLKGFGWIPVGLLVEA